MAQPKNLKKLTRARMERTGESYTTARKAILDNRPEPVAAQRAAERQQAKTKAPAPQTEPELPEYPAPHDVQQYDAALWHRVLTQSGVTHPLTGQPLSQALLFGLGGGIGFMLHTFSSEDSVDLALVTRAHPEPFTATLLERSATKVRIRTTGNAQAADANLEAGLDAGRAVVVRVSRAALPWVEDGSVDAADTIDVAVLGEMDGLLIIDAGEEELQLISPQDLTAARARHKRDKNYCAWVPSRRSPQEQALAANVLEAVQQSTDRMLGDAPLPGMPEHYARNFGVTGLRQWADRLADTDSAAGWSRMLADPALAADAAGQLQRFFAERRFAATDGFRTLFADFLTEAASLPQLSALASRATEYRQLAGQWQRFTTELRGLLQAPQPQGEFARLGTVLHELADAEQRAATGLRATLEPLRGN